eukprot:g5814.t1
MKLFRFLTFVLTFLHLINLSVAQNDGDDSADYNDLSKLFKDELFEEGEAEEPEEGEGEEDVDTVKLNEEEAKALLAEELRDGEVEDKSSSSENEKKNKHKDKHKYKQKGKERNKKQGVLSSSAKESEKEKKEKTISNSDSKTSAAARNTATSNELAKEKGAMNEQTNHVELNLGLDDTSVEKEEPEHVEVGEKDEKKVPVELPALEVAVATVPPPSYNRHFLPKPLNGPVNVQIRVLLQHIYRINQMEKMLTAGVRIFMLWLDPRLKYKKSILPPGIDGIPVDPTSVWIPHVEILNVVDKTIMHEAVTVYPSGHVFFVSRLKCDVTVDFEVKWFPFDRQNFLFEFGTFGYSRDLVWLNTTATNWEPAFKVYHSKSAQIRSVSLRDNDIKKVDSSKASLRGNETVVAIDTEQRTQEHFDISRDSNFLLGSNILANEEGQGFWVVDNFTGWQSIRDGEGARYSFVGVNALLEMHRGRVHFILVYVVPLIFIIAVSEGNFFFDVRDLEPRLSIAAALLLCMVSFQYTIENEIPRVSYPVWINWYLVGCYSFLVTQVLLMICILLTAGRRVGFGNRWTRKAMADDDDDFSLHVYGKGGMGSAEERRKQLDREELAEWLNLACIYSYPIAFGIFNFAMFWSIPK